MEGKEAIIAEIIGKAEKIADGIISDATSERDEVLETVRITETSKRDEAIAAARIAADEIVLRRKTLAELEARKTELAAKQRIIDETFNEAIKKILNMTDHIYREFIGDLIIRYAEEGDTVIVAERDTARLHADWLQSVSAKCGKHLTLSPETHKDKGGVILCGKLYDKNLTLGSILNAARDEHLPAITKRLFK